jgi:enoyl-CoA hydratase
MSNQAVRYELTDNVARIYFDDGKANALSPDALSALEGALDQAEKEARATLLIGRAGRLSAGFDLSVMRTGADAVRGLVTAGAEFLLRLYTFPMPTVVACTGHALAAGAIVLLTADTRIGARGDFKIGLNEVAIGMTLPIFGVEFARDRLSKRHFLAATTQARIFDPEGAVNAGFLDMVVAPESLLDTALAQAKQLAELSTGAYAATKRSAREGVERNIRETLAADMAKLAGPTG